MCEFNTFGPVDPAVHYHVNRLAQMLARQLAPLANQPILMQHMNLAITRLVNENNAHFAT
jgi:hypothetical protein